MAYLMAGAVVYAHARKNAYKINVTQDIITQ